MRNFDGERAEKWRRCEQSIRVALMSSICDRYDYESALKEVGTEKELRETVRAFLLERNKSSY